VHLHLGEENLKRAEDAGDKHDPARRGASNMLQKVCRIRSAFACSSRTELSGPALCIAQRIAFFRGRRQARAVRSRVYNLK